LLLWQLDLKVQILFTFIITNELPIFSYTNSFLNIFCHFPKWQCILSLGNSTAIYTDLKTLHPGGIRTRDLPFCMRKWWPLCHDARGINNFFWKTSENLGLCTFAVELRKAMCKIKLNSKNICMQGREQEQETKDKMNVKN
jgi:hypothetical protein